MSTIIVKTKHSIDTLIAPQKDDLKNKLIETTAKTFDIKPSAVIVEFQTYEEPQPENAPDILFRAETSLKRRRLLRSWAEGLLTAFKSFINNSGIVLPPDSRVAIKPYVIDSEWMEESL